MKNKFIIATFLSAFLLMAPNVHAMNARAYINDNQTVDKNKTWTLVFTGSVGFDDVTKQGITVTDSKGNLVDTSLNQGTDTKTILVNAPQGGYAPGQSYILNIGYKVHSSKGKALKNEYKIHFNIESNTNLVTFKDKNLEQIVRNKINKPTGDILKNDVEKITVLNIGRKNIVNISGIENFKNLSYLDLSNNQVSDISALKELNNISTLWLDNNEISDIKPLGYLTNLKYLSLSGNQISEISALKYLSNLLQLNIAANPISDINNLRVLTKLENLHLYDNEIMDQSNINVLYELKSLYPSDLSGARNEILIESKIKEILNKVIKPGMSNLQKEKALHDYIVINTKYDYDNYLKNTIPEESYSAYGVLCNGVGVCQGYAEAMFRLLNKVGIETMIITGTANGVGGWGEHAWNIVKINDKYYHLDATWDDPVPDAEGEVRWDYFNISDNQISKNHKWDTSLYPKCTEN